MEKDQSEKWNEYQKKLSTNGKNSYPANDAEKEWRASKEAAEKYNMETVYTAKKNVDKYQENYERMESRLKTDNASHDKITKQYEDAQAKLDKIQQKLEINDRILDVYKQVAEMHTHWYGKRYNELVSKFNELAPQFNKFLEVIVSQIPYMFDAIANDFSGIDIQQNVATARKEGYKSIQEIQIFNDVGMRYLQSEVDPYRTEIVSDFRSAKELMDSMQKNVEQIILQCDGADEFRSQFRNLVSSFKQVLDNVESQFVELMNKDREQIEKAEKLNTTK